MLGEGMCGGVLGEGVRADGSVVVAALLVCFAANNPSIRLAVGKRWLEDEAVEGHQSCTAACGWGEG